MLFPNNQHYKITAFFKRRARQNLNVRTYRCTHYDYWLLCYRYMHNYYTLQHIVFIMIIKKTIRHVLSMGKHNPGKRVDPFKFPNKFMSTRAHAIRRCNQDCTVEAIIHTVFNFYNWNLNVTICELNYEKPKTNNEINCYWTRLIYD